MARATAAAAAKGRPLYDNVREALTKRLIDGTWPPGTMLPSEQSLAGELGVSLGTLRKALDAMEAEHLLDRQQGRGTFVTTPDETRLVFQFFRFADDATEGRPPPVSKVRSIRRQRAGAGERAALHLPARSSVWVIERTRALDGRPVIAEEIYLPAALFPDLDRQPIPNSIYALYSKRYQVTINQASERLKAVNADAADAAILGCPEGTALLLVDRVARALDGKPVERRVSRCLTENLHYVADIR